MRYSFVFLFIFIFLAGLNLNAQISPGKLAAVHTHLEGLTNCTHCHTLGDKVSNEKCLACHTEIKSRINQHAGYHSSPAIRGKECVSCHSDHHGLNFQIIRFNKENFDHNQTGYKLSGAHVKKACADCHKSEHIAAPSIRKKKLTYLGLSRECLNCHEDYHRKSLSSSCGNCHGDESFKPAVKFNHANAKFKLNGQHQQVECVKCHKVTTRDGKPYKAFTGIAYTSCSSCHTDPHHDQFGQNCSQCHSEVSFHTVKGISNFDHSKTGFRLENKHQFVACNTCHKTSLTDPLKHERCTDCHKDYHKGQFTNQGLVRDCGDCHTTRGFTGSSYTIEQHNQGSFKLQGSHLATPCFTCHKKQETWSFRQIGSKCIDCHKDVHATLIASKYYPESDCRNCHNESQWNKVKFDHGSTAFALTGAHLKPGCRTCHFRKDSSGAEFQKFSGLTTECTTCHTDNHYGQFEAEGRSDCLKCHNTDLWKISTFDHNTRTAFKLDGQHINVPCAKCHKPVTQNQHTFIWYKIKESRCENCH